MYGVLALDSQHVPCRRNVPPSPAKPDGRERARAIGFEIGGTHVSDGPSHSVHAQSIEKNKPCPQIVTFWGLLASVHCQQRHPVAWQNAKFNLDPNN